ncbi:hypothetical protein K474DRAFT_1668679 [Panus rudis PR-1116 ss-1]|nr:hypothetical protein K474DRAFT_1668679 [Panus rudis PR-1116 ss-1]
MKILAVAVTSFSLIGQASAGLVAYGLCQTGGLLCIITTGVQLPKILVIGCNALVMACYGAAGAVFGTVAAPAAPPAILACNAALGTCSSACAATALIAPIP